MKRILFYVYRHIEDEAWKGGAGIDEEALRSQIRDQMTEEIPVVIIPPGVYLSSIDLEEEEKAPEKEK